MLFLTIVTTFISAIALAAPTSLEARAASCAPTSYTLSAYSLTAPTGPIGFARVEFNLKSNFADTAGIDDPVINGSHCAAMGTPLPNSNECDVPGRKLLFDLRASQEKARYQITHTWVCNGQTWMSGNDVQIGPLDCTGAPCFIKEQTFAPQNVRMICPTPRC